MNVSTQTPVLSSFDKAFKNTSTVIEYSKEWANGTGYYNGAVRGKAAPVLKSGDRVKCVSDNGRRMVIIGTKLGNVVVFDRYSERADIQVCNLPAHVEFIFGLAGRLTDDQIDFALGGEYNYANLASRIDRMFEAVGQHVEDAPAEPVEKKAISINAIKTCAVRNVVRALEQDQGKYVDLHDGKIKTVSHAAVLNNHTGQNLVIVDEKSICCLNSFHMTQDGHVELSRWAVADCVENDGNDLITRLQAWNERLSTATGLTLGKFSHLITFTNGSADIQLV